MTMTSPDAPEAVPFPPRKAAWTAVFVFLVLYSFAYLDRQVLVLLVDPIKNDLGVTDTQISILQGAAFVLFYTLCGLPIGWAVDRYPRRWIIFVGICVWSVAAAASGLAKSYGQLLVARSGVGAGEASLHPSVYSMLADLFPKERLTSAMAVYATGAAIGSGLSLMLGGLVVGLANAATAYHLPLIGEVKPWQLVFILTGAPGLIIAFFVFLVTEPPRRGRMNAKPSSTPAATLAFMRRQWRFYAAHFVGFGIFGILSNGYAAWVPSYLIRRFELRPEHVGGLLGFQTLACLAGGALFFGYLADHLLRKGIKDAHFRIYVWALILFGIAGVGAMHTTSVVAAYACMTVVKFISPFLAIAAGALQITAPNEYRGQVSAIFLLVFNIVGAGFGPLVVASVSDYLLGGPSHIGTAMLIMFATLTPLGVIALAWGMKPMRQAVIAAEGWK